MTALPDVLIVRAYVARGLVVWIGARALLSLWLVSTCVGCNLTELLFGAGTAFGAVAVSVALSLLETRRRREWVLLGNLGVRTWMVGVMFAVPAVLAETVIQVARAAAG